MHKTTLNKLIEHPEVYYIYDLRGAVFGIDNLGEYIVVVKDGLVINDTDKANEILKKYGLHLCGLMRYGQCVDSFIIKIF